MSVEFVQPPCPKCGNTDKTRMSFGFVAQDQRLYVEMVRCSDCGAVWQQNSDKKTGLSVIVEITQRVK